MSGKKLVLLLTAALFAATLWGCGSNRDSGDSAIVPEGSGGTGGGEIVDAQVLGIDNCAQCHDTINQQWLASGHANQDSSPGGPHTADSKCGACHNPDEDAWLMPAAYGQATRDVIGCESCHGGGSAHRGIGPLPTPKPGMSVCGECHGDLSIYSGHAYREPFSDIIVQRFEEGRHTGKARTGTCGACHSHEGFLEYAAVGKADTIDGISELTRTLDSLSEFNVKTCATCHEPHTGNLRSIGDVLATGENTADFPGNPVDGEDRVVYSSEYNLCTACHQVSLAAIWNEDAGYSGRGMIEYSLSDAYLQENVQYGTDNEDTSNISYHANSYQSRKFLDTHFNGTISKELYYYDIRKGVEAATKNHKGEVVVTDPEVLAEMEAYYQEYLAAPANIELTGYNVNPGSPNACSYCHDVHTANKILAEGELKANRGMNYEEPIAKAATYGQGVGSTHANYLHDPFSRNSDYPSCTPCHTGRQFVYETVGGEAPATRFNSLGCVSCHDLAVPLEANTTAPRTMSEDTLAFASGETIATAELGANQVCFECHKGRKGYNDALDVTTVYGVNYLHYSPQFSTLYGMEGMIPSYDGKDYTRNWEGHYHVTSDRPTDCVGCHNIHEEYAPYSSHSDTTYGREEFDTSLTTNLCGSCHYYTDPLDTSIYSDGDPTTTKVARSFNVLEARTEAFADVLKETMLSELSKLVTTDNDAAIIVQGLDGANVVLTEADRAKYVALFTADDSTSFDIQTDVAYQLKRLKVYITGSSRDITGSRLVTNDLATAGAIWKNFNYDDKGGWAHNSILARQTMFDAIEKLDATKLGDIAARYEAKLVNLGFTAQQIAAMIDGTSKYGNLMSNMDAGTTVRTLPAVQ